MSQESKLLEDKKFLHQELRQRCSNEETERQEIEPTVAQPVLSPKYSSIQSDSEPDQIFEQREYALQSDHITSKYPYVFHRSHMVHFN